MDREITQWYPFVEWSLPNWNYIGNPFDVVAYAIFKHEESGEVRKTPMFYDQLNQWKFRFTGTRLGKWTFTTQSDYPDLDGKSGVVQVVPNPNPNAHGFVSHLQEKWAWQGTDEVFVPQFVMYDHPGIYYNQPRMIDDDIRTFFVEHGFNGFHTNVRCRWFDIDEEKSSRIRNPEPNPDQRTFEALELLITKAHAAGGLVHIWAWGDEQREQTPKRWGLNGEVDKRLIRYIAARLGPVPGWTMGYGFDLDEWVTEQDLQRWHQYFYSNSGWKHLLGARDASPNTAADSLGQIYEGLDYAAYEHHRPTYDDYVRALNRRPGKPVFSEDRFRVRFPLSYPEKDYNEELTRRGLYLSTMAGGVANIWGNNHPDGWREGEGSQPYNHPEWIQTWRLCFRDRFLRDMIRDNRITDGVGLRTPDFRHTVFYKENTDQIEVDLSRIPGPLPAVAVNTVLKYDEVSMGILHPGKHALALPGPSDWFIAVGYFGHRPIFSEKTKEVGLNLWDHRDVGGWHGTYVCDFDNDGFEDMFMTSHGIGWKNETGENALFRNLGDGRFENVARSSGLFTGLHGRLSRELHGASWFDYDNDGDFDIYLPTTDTFIDDNLYSGFDEVFRNNGDGTFSNFSTELALPRLNYSRRGGLALDIENDGDLDLIFVNAATERTENQKKRTPADNYRCVYVNDAGRFVLEYRGIDYLKWSEGITSGDFDNDGDVDVFIANNEPDRGEHAALILWENDGHGFFKWKRDAFPPSKEPIINGSVTLGDVDNDGDLDVYFLNGLYINEHGRFVHRAQLGGDSEHMFFADLDNDADLDLVTGGIFWNDGKGNFVRDDLGISLMTEDGKYYARGAIDLDYDNDGDLDLIINTSDRDRPYLRFYENELNNGNHWLRLKLYGKDGQAGCPGARVWVYSDSDNLIGYREVTTATGFVCGPSPTQHFGLGKHDRVDVKVRWLSGEEKWLRRVAADQSIVIRSD
jgi:hypothetical protein